jgi:Holliday junction resolvase RusA-like endonuclease
MEYRFWCDRVRKAVGRKLPIADLVGALDWTAYFEPPQSWSKKRRAACIGELHCAKPDRDNIDKAVLDCLYKQDSGIAMGTIQKRWDWTARLEITIRYKAEG